MKPQIKANGPQGSESTQRLLQMFLLVWVSVLLCAGCKPEEKSAAEARPNSSDTSPKVAPDVNPVGTYALASVDGKTVPCTLQHEGHTMTIKSGSFIINADGTCASKMSLQGMDAAIEVKASYTQEGSKLTMKWQGAGMTEGAIEGNTFTMKNEGMVFAYRK